MRKRAACRPSRGRVRLMAYDTIVPEGVYDEKYVTGESIA